MAHHRTVSPRWPLAGGSQAVALLALACTGAQAQDPTLKAVTVNERSALPVDVTGFGDVPLRELPLAATVVDRRQIEASGARRLADLTQFDASVTDAYNAPGYWDFLTIRGFTLDNRFNYRREGLPISAETSIPLDNKERIEILKGTSGIQSGTSAPGGLVNYVVKRPTQQALREVRIEAASGGSLLGAADLSGRFGAGNAFGWRLNLAHEQLRPQVRSMDGERSLVAAAADWRINRDTVLEGEFEWSRKSQPSQAAFSLLGSTLPAPVDPRLNLGNQPWGQPSVFGAFTGTLRLQQALGPRWNWSAQLGTQKLNTDDRLAFPFGCSAEGNYDRFCSDGSFDFYDFRSENERRQQSAAAFNLKGKVEVAGMSHDLNFGLLSSKVKNRFDRQAYNWVGIGTVDGNSVVPADPTLTDENTHRDERSLELSVQDVIRVDDRFTAWLGLRHTRLERDSVRTDGSRPTAYSQGLTTPWLAASYKIAPQAMLYASWGQGMESEVAPNRARYTNAGQPLPALKSRQMEVGIKGGDAALHWGATLFAVTRPAWADEGACSGTLDCTRRVDGQARHRGLELEAGTASGPLMLQGGLTLMHARRSGSTITPAVNGKRPTNVPDWVARARAGWKFASVPGLELQSVLSHEGRRAVLADESVMLPAWTKLDVLLRYERKLGGMATTWTVGIDNVTDKRYWKESPFQFGHAYLYPGAARSLRIGLTAAL